MLDDIFPRVDIGSQLNKLLEVRRSLYICFLSGGRRGRGEACASDQIDERNIGLHLSYL